MNQEHVHIDLDHLANIAHTGVRRAAVFMGFGLNAAHRPDFQDYQLHKLSPVPGQTNAPFDFMPSDLPGERIAEMKQEFGVWVVACGMRELMEHYALMLDHVHRFSLLVSAQLGHSPDMDRPAQHKKFTRLGVSKKLDTLLDRFSIDVPEATLVNSLYEARNCFTHDLGVVTPKRCIHDGRLIIRWKAMEIVAKGVQTGNLRPIHTLLGQVLGEETAIVATIVVRERVFSAGDSIRLNQQDLWEICYFFKQFVIPDTLRKFTDWMSANGISVMTVEPKNLDPT